jgi:DUF4097 and DUF4098 domain-containing protein YvlB
MTRSTLLAAALAFSVTATAAYAADSEATFDKTLTVTGAPTVSLATGSGYIHVTTGPDSLVHIIGHVHDHSADATHAKQIADAPPIEQSGNTITIGSNHGDSDLYRNISIDYDVTTPRSTSLTTHTGSGRIEISGIQAPISAASGSGSLTLALTGSGDVKVATGSGPIHVDGVAGGLRASTGSGTIEINGSPTADWHLATGSGRIHLKLPNDARFTLSASTGSGSIRVDQPMLMQGSLNRHHVSGTVNGGGPAIHAATGSGEIVINGGATTVGDLHDKNSLHVPGATDCVDHPDQPGCRKN